MTRGGGAKKVIAIQGERGSYSDIAVDMYCPEPHTVVCCEDFSDVFEAVKKGRAQQGMIPIENTTSGSISETYDLLLKERVYIVGEVKERIKHSLIGLEGASISDIKTVYSHPQAILQCKKILRKRKWDIVPSYDTAGSLKILKKGGDVSSAAIASGKAAGIYGMRVLREGVEDNKMNHTRFFVIEKRKREVKGGDKSSVIFATRHKPGSLFSCLKPFVDNELNLTKVESRPKTAEPWTYVFILDFEGNPKNADAEAALGMLKKQALFSRFLGCYSSWKGSTEPGSST